MTQTKLHTLNYRNAITERDRRAQDVSDFRTITTASLPQVPPNCSYSYLKIEVSQWDNTKFILRGAIGSDCFTREVPATLELREYKQTFQHVDAIGAL